MIKSKETNLKTVNIFQVKYGTININNPDTIYINCKTIVTPSRRITQETIDNIQEKLQELLKHSLIHSNKFKNKYIMNFNLCKDTLKINKKNNLKFEVYMEQDNGITSFNDIKNEVKELVHSFSNDFKETLEENGLDVHIVQ